MMARMTGAKEMPRSATAGEAYSYPSLSSRPKTLFANFPTVLKG